MQEDIVDGKFRWYLQNRGLWGAILDELDVGGPDADGPAVDGPDVGGFYCAVVA